MSLSDGIDSTTAQAKLTFHIFVAFPEFERVLAREPTMPGLRAARERGRVGGRPGALGDDEIAQVQSLIGNPEGSTAWPASSSGT